VAIQTSMHQITPPPFLLQNYSVDDFLENADLLKSKL